MESRQLWPEVQKAWQRGRAVTSLSLSLRWPWPFSLCPCWTDPPADPRWRLNSQCCSLHAALSLCEPSTLTLIRTQSFQLTFHFSCCALLSIHCTFFPLPYPLQTSQSGEPPGVGALGRPDHRMLVRSPGLVRLIGESESFETAGWVGAATLSEWGGGIFKLFRKPGLCIDCYVLCCREKVNF